MQIRKKGCDPGHMQKKSKDWITHQAVCVYMFACMHAFACMREVGESEGNGPFPPTLLFAWTAGQLRSQRMPVTAFRALFPFEPKNQDLIILSYCVRAHGFPPSLLLSLLGQEGMGKVCLRIFP